MRLWTILERAAHLYPRQELAEAGRVQSYAATRERCGRLDAFLRAHGLAPGERISVLSWNSIAYLELYFAAARGGLVLNPLNVRLAACELVEILRDCEPRVLFAEAEFEPLVREVLALGVGVEALVWIGGIPAEAAGLPCFDYEFQAEAARPIPAPVEWLPDALAQLYYTSGTTGRSKGVMLTQRNLATHALATIGELGLSDGDTWAHIAPMFHLADAWATFALTWVGGRHVFLPRFDAAAALALLERERVTITNLVPTMLNLMLRHEDARSHDYRHLRRMLSGGAPIAPALVREILDVFGCEYVQTYGMTETSPFLTLGLLKPHLAALPAEERLGWLAKTGRPFAAVELRVTDEQGRDVAADGRAVGEIRVRGETVTPGYWRRPEETAAAFAEGWLKTGDLATIDAEGYVEIVDRKKDMILTGGENVYSTEVEHVLFAHPEVLEAAVYGLPDPVWGEIVCAAVVLRGGAGTGAAARTASTSPTSGPQPAASPGGSGPDALRHPPAEPPSLSRSRADLEEHCRARLASYKVPRQIEFLAELPRTGSGKIAKRLLRDERAKRTRPG